MTTVNKLNKIKETKTAIKAAIIEKGVAVSDSDAFSTYPNKIKEIKSGGGASGFSLDYVPGEINLLTPYGEVHTSFSTDDKDLVNKIKNETSEFSIGSDKYPLTWEDKAASSDVNFYKYETNIGALTNYTITSNELVGNTLAAIYYIYAERDGIKAKLNLPSGAKVNWTGETDTFEPNTNNTKVLNKGLHKVVIINSTQCNIVDTNTANRVVAIVIPGMVGATPLNTKFYEGQFQNFSNLKVILFSKTLQFSNSISSSELPNSIFSGCTSLKHITLPEFFVKITDTMFSGDNLESICFKGKPVNASVFTTENSSTFNNSLTTITWPSLSNTENNGMNQISQLSKLKFLSINCNNSANTGVSGYSQLESLEYLKLNNLKNTKMQEFSSVSNLRQIDIIQNTGDEQGVINSATFMSCPNLESINIYKISGAALQFQTNAFVNSNPNLEITVPFGTLDEYQTASPSYASIMVERTEVK